MQAHRTTVYMAFALEARAAYFCLPALGRTCWLPLTLPISCLSPIPLSFHPLGSRSFASSAPPPPSRPADSCAAGRARAVQGGEGGGGAGRGALAPGAGERVWGHERGEGGAGRGARSGALVSSCSFPVLRLYALPSCLSTTVYRSVGRRHGVLERSREIVAGLGWAGVGGPLCPVPPAWPLPPTLRSWWRPLGSRPGSRHLARSHTPLNACRCRGAWQLTLPRGLRW